MTKIQSGLGNGYEASVNNLNKLETRAVTEEMSGLHSRGGHKYNIITSVLNIDDADKNAILYFKNNEDRDFYVEAYGIMLGTSTGGSGVEWTLNSVRNPTAGTIISAGTDITPVNFNVGSNNTLDATCKEMASANQTFTDGTEPFLATLGTGTGLQIVSVPGIILPKGTALGLTFEAQTGNTSQNVQAFIFGYVNKLITTDVVGI